MTELVDELKLDVSNPLEYLNGDLKRVILTSWSIITIYSFCEMGQMVASQFDMFEKELCQCNFYLFSRKLQQIHLIVLANAQQPTTVNGFGNLECMRQSMKTVISKFAQSLATIPMTSAN